MKDRHDKVGLQQFLVSLVVIVPPEVEYNLENYDTIRVQKVVDAHDAVVWSSLPF